MLKRYRIDLKITDEEHKYIQSHIFWLRDEEFKKPARTLEKDIASYLNVDKVEIMFLLELLVEEKHL